MTEQAEQLVEAARRWWSTEIIDIHPGSIGIRGYAIETLIGRLTFPQMIWLMLRGDVPSPEQARLLEAALVASVDHGPQAPSISIARMAITCGVDLNNAMGSAINVLGDIHGGAGQQCMALYELIDAEVRLGGDLTSATRTVLAAYAERHGKIIPGFGHRFHPIDPRVEPLLQLVSSAADCGVVSGRFAHIARAIVSALADKVGKPVPMNIDGVTAVIFCELGFPPELGRGLFVLSRSVGILAHSWEQMQRKERIKGPMPKEIPYTYNGPSHRTLKDDENVR